MLRVIPFSLCIIEYKIKEKITSKYFNIIIFEYICECEVNASTCTESVGCLYFVGTKSEAEK